MLLPCPKLVRAKGVKHRVDVTKTEFLAYGSRTHVGTELYLQQGVPILSLNFLQDRVLRSFLEKSNDSAIILVTSKIEFDVNTGTLYIFRFHA